MPVRFDDGRPISLFRNDDVVPVVGGGRYTEAMLLKPISNGGDEPLLADPTITVWGRRQSDRDERRQIEASTRVQVRSDGWYEVTADFEIPEDVALIRSFGLELAAPDDAVVAVAVRDHALTSLGDTTTIRSSSWDVSGAPVIGPEFAGLDERVEEYRRLEASAVLQRARFDELARLIAGHQDPESIQSARRKAQSDKTLLENRRDGVARKLTRYQALPVGYWGRLTDTLGRTLVRGAADGSSYDNGKRMSQPGLGDGFAVLRQDAGDAAMRSLRPGEDPVLNTLWQLVFNDDSVDDAEGWVHVQSMSGSWLYRHELKAGQVARLEVYAVSTTADPGKRVGVFVQHGSAHANTKQLSVSLAGNRTDPDWWGPYLWSDELIGGRLKGVAAMIGPDPHRSAGLSFTPDINRPAHLIQQTQALVVEIDKSIEHVTSAIASYDAILAASAAQLDAWQAEKDRVRDVLDVINIEMAEHKTHLLAATRLPKPTAGRTVEAEGLVATVGVLGFLGTPRSVTLHESATGAIDMTYVDGSPASVMQPTTPSLTIATPPSSSGSPTVCTSRSRSKPAR